MNFLCEELFFNGQNANNDIVNEESQDVFPETKEISDLISVDLESEDGGEEDPNCFEFLHSRFAPSRHLKNKFFDEEIAVSILN